ncbi:Twin-arginine translocation protein TatB [Enhygromyxa salina]|uniref:Twin-arginine translocation protein TatB n=1 Tax=Enhygromyxa salina TaxID=215803 RepID=A0A0C2CQT7_9BACT|nr:hypothetical protein [Enhygromyxa salina]KIG12080.1 Twin-arginine translocation protein TatB [Enhygromyxa salina]
MFGLGMMEIGLIIALAVMLFPPKELPKLARSVARIYGQVRKTAEDFRATILEDEDLRSPIDEIKGAYNDARWEVRDAERKARQQLAKAQMELRMATARRLQAEREQEVKEGAAPGPASGSPSEAPTALAASSASSASPVRIAASEPDDNDNDDDDDDDAHAGGPVAGADPRKVGAKPGDLAAARPPPYTPPTSVAASPASQADGKVSDSAEPREGVA